MRLRALPNAFAILILAACCCVCAAVRADDFVPRAQDKPPGPPLSPQEAIAKMTVPEGFTVELVAGEPDIVNPVAMTFDERGRIWITESLEYPRLTPGPGSDRVKVLEDTDGDGKAEKVTIFAEGLNIPSGIAVGHGGVWVANSPDLLFLQDTDGDGKADKQEVVLTGFGRADTHELPNSLTWGPDGWLYGLNGVFNNSRIQHQGKLHEFTCALFRIHPRTRAFEIFAQGTSNPWGVAWNPEGSAFLSACVIDHLWHLTETGYYVRQGGPYPPFTSIIPSIVKHHHQKAAYCGIHYFDSDAYPAEYRDRLYMGNIHGGCINVDVLERDGSSYLGTTAPDFLTANDAWFMPVVQKTGPDGCLYILDWYDRYHCYQDANRDPKGIDRLRGRLYRVRYKETPRAGRVDLAKESDDQLLQRLRSPNIFYRDIAQRLLNERNDAKTRPQLEQLALDGEAPRKTRLHALWTLVSSDSLSVEFHQKLLADADPGFRAWGVRAAGNFHKVDPAVRSKVLSLASDPAADVRLQVAIASCKLDEVDPLPVLLSVLSASAEDKLIPHIVWQNLQPLLEQRSDEFLKLAAQTDPRQSPALAAMMPRVVDRILAGKNPDVASLLSLLTTGKDADSSIAQKCLAALAKKVQTREISGERLSALRPKLEEFLHKLLGGPADNPLYLDAALLATTLQDPNGFEAVRKVYATANQPAGRRLQALDALIAARDKSIEKLTAQVLGDKATAEEIQIATLASLGRSGEAWVSKVVLENYAAMEPNVQPKAIELLTDRRQWAMDLMDVIAKKQIPATALNANQVRKLLASRDKALSDKVRAEWGTVRTERNPRREQVINEMRTFIRATPGDAKAGQQVFAKVCAQCHKIYGEGQEVGPDITGIGRSSFEQLLSNVFDPSLVIGAAYQARTVITDDGRVLTGLLAEDSPERVVLKIQGGKLETIPRANIAESKLSQLSLMPEELEKQLKPQELADLFAFLTLDKPPSDPSARQLPGLRELPAQKVVEREKMNAVVGRFAAGFHLEAIDADGLEIVAEHFGRTGVLRVHPVRQDKPCIMAADVDVPKDKHTRLMLGVSHQADADWNLVVRAGGKTLHDSIISAKTTRQGWSDITVDLTDFAGQKIKLEVVNRANNWFHESGFFSRIDTVSE